MVEIIRAERGREHHREVSEQRGDLEQGPCAIFHLGIGILSFRNVGDGRGIVSLRHSSCAKGFQKERGKNNPRLVAPGNALTQLCTAV